MKKLWLLLLIAALSSGCALNQVNLSEQKNAEMKQRLAACENEIRTTPAVQLIDGEVIFNTLESANRVVLMASTSRINDRQANALVEYVQLTQKCRQITLEYGQYWPAQTAEQRRYYGDIDTTYAKLLSREITIGQANREKSEKVNKMLTVIDSINQRARDAQESQNRQADSQNRANWANALQRMGQAFGNNAQYYQNQNNQLINNNQNPAPTTTRCNQWGSQINCTTQ
jgi:hypothetical protein